MTQALRDRLFVQVINLDRDADRLATTTAQLKMADIAWKRLPAVGPSAQDVLAHPLYNRERRQYLLGKDMLKGQMGCFLSHLEAAKAFVQSGHAYGLVLEDDIAIKPDSMARLEDALAYLEAGHIDWDCINLTASQKLRRRVVARLDGGTLYRAFHFPLKTSGLVWHTKSAQDFLHWVDEVGIYTAIDVQLRDWLTLGPRGFAFDPAPIGLRPEPSSIQPAQAADQVRRRTNRFSRTELRQKLPLYYRSIWRWTLNK